VNWLCILDQVNGREQGGQPLALAPHAVSFALLLVREEFIRVLWGIDNTINLHPTSGCIQLKEHGTKRYLQTFMAQRTNEASLSILT